MFKNFEQKLIEIIKEEMRKRSMSQERIGELIGVNKPTMSKKMNGKIKFTLEEAEIILNYFFYEIKIEKELR